jgi:hypothetical protein
MEVIIQFEKCNYDLRLYNIATCIAKWGGGDFHYLVFYL